MPRLTKISRRTLLGGLGAGVLVTAAPVAAMGAARTQRPAGNEAQAAAPGLSTPPAGVRFGVNYLPSKAWWFAWLDWDPASIAADLNAISRLGFDHIRVQCFWQYFQPDASYVSTTMTGHLVELLDIADDAGLDVEVTVLDGYMTGYTYNPAWTTGQNIMTAAGVIASEQQLLATLAGAVTGHKRFLGFDLSNEIDNIAGNQPGGVTSAQGDAWLQAMLQYASSVAPGRVHVNGASQDPWLYGGTFTRPAMAAAGSVTAFHYYDFTGNATTSPALEAEYMVAMVQAYAADPSRLVWLEEFGVSTSPGFWLPPADVPDFLEACIRNVMTSANLFAWTLWASHNVRQTLTGFVPRSYGYGMLDVDNQPTPSGLRVASLIREFRSSPPPPTPRSTGLVISDTANPGTGTAGQAFVDLVVKQGIHPSIVLQSMTGDAGYLSARGITELVTLAEVSLLDGTEYGSLTAAFGNVGISDDSDVSAGNLDGSGDSFSAEALAGLGVTPGATLNAGGFSFAWPDVAAGQPDNVAASGQGVALPSFPAQVASLGLLGAATSGPSSFDVALEYSDGTLATSTVTFSDWTLNAGTATPSAGNTVAATCPYHNCQTCASGRKTVPTYLFVAAVPLDDTRTLSSVAFSVASAGVAHVFAVAGA